MSFVLALEELEPVLKEIDRFAKGIVILRGDLAAGKTTLVKAYVTYKGLSDEVTSPTFSLQQQYDGEVYHYDIYNHGLEHFISLGMLEELEKDGLHFVEWGDQELENILENVGLDYLTIEIEKISPTKREYTLCTH